MLTFLVRKWDKTIRIIYIAKETMSQHTREKHEKRTEGNKKYKQELLKPTRFFDTCMLSKEHMWHIYIITLTGTMNIEERSQHHKSILYINNISLKLADADAGWGVESSIPRWSKKRIITQTTHTYKYTTMNKKINTPNTPRDDSPKKSKGRFPLESPLCTNKRSN